VKVYFTDETNVNRNPQLGFFIYGGIVIDEVELKPLSQSVLEAKRRFGVAKERPIKWPNINWKGKGVLDPHVHEQIKEAILESRTIAVDSKRQRTMDCIVVHTPLLRLPTLFLRSAKIDVARPGGDFFKKAPKRHGVSIAKVKAVADWNKVMWWIA